MEERVLVTGSTGFIGSRTVDALLKQGVTVRTLLRSGSRAGDNGMQGVEICRCDYDDPESLGRAVLDVDIVIHLAGVTKAVDEAAFRAGNVMPAVNLLEAVKRHNPGIRRFVLVSSLAAAGPAVSAHSGVRETETPHPVSAYGRSKLLGEQLCLQKAGGIPLTIIRPPAVYGPGDRDILEMFQMMQKGFLLSAGDGRTQRFSMVHVDDLVDGMLLAARSETAKGQTYFIASPEPYCWEDIIEAARPAIGFRMLIWVPIPRPLVFALGFVFGAAARLANRPALINLDKTNELVQDYWVCSSEKAFHDLGFTARIPLDKGIRETIAWYREKGWL
jgi:nucleoside-diphosphate-sugar epimerase